MQALEYACETVPSLILAASAADGGGEGGGTEGGGTGALFHGGYRCVGNARREGRT